MEGQLHVDTTGLDLGKLDIEHILPAALAQGAEIIRAKAVELTPVETGRLAGSAEVHVDGADRASITYAGPYARYQHERLDLRHEHGQAKFLEQPLMTEAEKANEVIAKAIHEALGE